MMYWPYAEYTIPLVVILIAGYNYLSKRYARKLPNAGGVVITGASSGIGEATALYLDNKGYSVFAGVRNSADYDRLKGLLSPRSTPVVLDVTQKSSIAEAVNTVTAHVKQTNIGLVALINNAGICVLGPLECLPEEEMRYNFEVNLFGLINVTNAFLPLLRERSKFPKEPLYPQDIATIIHIGSTMGKVSFPFYGPYAMTKYALEAMVDAQRLELSQSSNVRVCLFELGNIATPMFEKNNVRMKGNLNAMMDVYNPFLTTLPKVVDVVTQGAITPLRVAQCIETALISANPKSRYQVGWEAHAMPVIWTILPDTLRDIILLNLFKLITNLKR
jgi:NAD(P)-dependent dehydrogenase (short-subunit alcohol dehydrogenase family)